MDSIKAMREAWSSFDGTFVDRALEVVRLANADGKIDIVEKGYLAGVAAGLRDEWGDKPDGYDFRKTARNSALSAAAMLDRIAQVPVYVKCSHGLEKPKNH